MCNSGGGGVDGTGCVLGYVSIQNGLIYDRLWDNNACIINSTPEKKENFEITSLSYLSCIKPHESSLCCYSCCI